MDNPEQGKKIIEDMARVLEVLARDRNNKTHGVIDTESLVNYMKLSGKVAEKAMDDLIKLGYEKDDATKAIGTSIREVGKLLRTEGISGLVVPMSALDSGQRRA